MRPVLLLGYTVALVLSAPAAAPPTSPAEPPAEFIDDVRLLFQVVTCQDGALPENLDAKTVASYCAQMKPKFARYRGHWGAPATAFLTSVRPGEVPGELVYPFGGGDLMMALTTFPEARTITTLSLELPGDPRRLKTLSDKAALAASLKQLDETVSTTLLSNDSKSANLSKGQRGELPGQLSMHLIGLALHDYEPVSVRYFRVEADGRVHYLTPAEVAALDGTTASSLRAAWKAPDFSPAFANVEVQYVPKGQPGAPRRVHRHLAADLSNDGLTKAPGVLKHLEAKGRVSAMTKAASYLLWSDTFSALREYLVSHAEVMLSDSTGVPPRYWKKAGFAVETYGSFQKSFLGTWEGYQQELRDTWAAQPARKLPMRFGYPDGSPEKRSHLMVAKRAAAQDAGVARPPKQAP